MNSKLENRLSMYRTVIAVCDKVAPSLQAVPALWTNYQLFKATVAEYDDMVKKQIRNLEGLTADKINAREKLIAKIMTISGMIKSYADESSDSDLYATVHFSPSTMRKMRENNLYQSALIVRELTENNFAGLAPYGLTLATLNEFMTIIDDFALKMEEPEEARKMRVAYTAAIKDMDKRLRDLLSRRIDTSIRTIGESDPLLLQKYTSARNVYNYGIRHKKGAITAFIPAILSGKVNDTAGIPVPDALVSVEGTNISVFTDDDGEYLIDTITPGTCNIIVTAENYIEARENNLTFASGDDLTRDFILEASDNSSE